MRYQSVMLASAIALSVAGCSHNSSTGPAPTYNDVSGTYAGPVSGTTQGVALSGTVTLTVTQSSGTLGGSYGLSGLLTDGVNTVSILGTGTLSGSIAEGNNPSVNITARSGDCPAFSSHFSGSYDTANSRMTLSGPVQVYYADCSGVFLTYQMTFIITR